MPEELPLDPELIDLLSSDTRREILGLLQDRRRTVTELAEDLDLQKATVHEHLKKLVAADLVDKQEDERLWVYYELAPQGKRILNPDRTRFYLVVGLGALAALVAAGAIGFYLAAGAAPQAAPTDEAAASGLAVQVEDDQVFSGPVQLDARLEGEDVSSSGTRAYLLGPEDAERVQRDDPGARGIPLTVRTAEGGDARLSTDASVPEGTYFVYVRTAGGTDNRATMPAVTVQGVDVDLSSRTWHVGLSGPLDVRVTQEGAPVDGLVLLEPRGGEGASLTAHLAGGHVEVPAERLDRLDAGEHRVRVLPEDGSGWVDAGSMTIARPAVAVTPPRLDAGGQARLTVHATGVEGPLRAEAVALDGAELVERSVDDERTTLRVDAGSEDLSVRVGRQAAQTVERTRPVDVSVLVEDGPTFTLEVQHANGTALSGAAVRLDGDGLGFTNDTGALGIERPAEGLHRLTVLPPDGAPVERGVDVDGWTVEERAPSLDVTAAQTATGPAPAIQVEVHADGPAHTPLALTASVDGRSVAAAALEAPPNGTASTEIALPTGYAAGQRLDLDVDTVHALSVSTDNRTTTNDTEDGGGGGGGGGGDAAGDLTADDGTQLSVDVSPEAVDDAAESVEDAAITEPVLDRARDSGLDGSDGAEGEAQDQPETAAPGGLVALAVLAVLALARRRWT